MEEPAYPMKSGRKLINFMQIVFSVQPYPGIRDSVKRLALGKRFLNMHLNLQGASLIVPLPGNLQGDF